jgi:transcriptional regulator with XRE-family HTH domain
MATLADRLNAVHPKMLRADGESDRKKLVGRRVERALSLARLTQQEAAYAMGYADQGVVSRWCSGLERPHFDKLYALDGFTIAWVLALAEGTPEIDVETTIRIRRVA